jgi:hypothetical protein
MPSSRSFTSLTVAGCADEESDRHLGGTIRPTAPHRTADPADTHHAGYLLPLAPESNPSADDAGRMPVVFLVRKAGNGKTRAHELAGAGAVGEEVSDDPYLPRRLIGIATGAGAAVAQLSVEVADLTSTAGLTRMSLPVPVLLERRCPMTRGYHDA